MEMIEVFLKDLKEGTQEDILNFYGYKNEGEGNLDVTPLFVLEKE